MRNKPFSLTFRTVPERLLVPYRALFTLGKRTGGGVGGAHPGDIACFYPGYNTAMGNGRSAGMVYNSYVRGVLMGANGSGWVMITDAGDGKPWGSLTALTRARGWP